MEFDATWCGPCAIIAPAFSRYSEEYSDITFVSVDVDELSSHPLVGTVISVPTFMFYKEGVKVAGFSGAAEGRLKSGLESM